VARLQAAFRKQRLGLPAADRNWGGRRQSLLTPEEEAAFLKPWLESAASGNLVVVSPIRAALAQRLGQPVKPSVVYRLLARHGWRKVAPDTRHPKSKPEVQEDWKKNSLKCWTPC
jgi:transposase